MAYTESQKKSINKYRQANLEKLKEYDRQRQKTKYADEEYRKQKLEKMKAYRDKKREEKAKMGSENLN